MQTMTTDLRQLNYQTFLQQLHSKFQVKTGDGASLELKLIIVEERQISPKIEVFFLRFLGPISPRLPQQIHSLEHAVLGTVELFMTAVGADPEGIEYEVVFNRFRKTEP